MWHENVIRFPAAGPVDSFFRWCMRHNRVAQRNPRVVIRSGMGRGLKAQRLLHHWDLALSHDHSD